MPSYMNVIYVTKHRQIDVHLLLLFRDYFLIICDQFIYVLSFAKFSRVAYLLVANVEYVGVVKRGFGSV